MLAGKTISIQTKQQLASNSYTEIKQKLIFSWVCFLHVSCEFLQPTSFPFLKLQKAASVFFKETFNYASYS